MAMRGISWHIARMETRIEKRVGIRATSDHIWDILSDFPGWNRWNAMETDIQGTLGFGAPVTLTEVLPDLPPRPVQATLTEWQPLAQLIWVEKRGWLFSMVRYFEIEELEKGSCILATGAQFQGLRAELFMDRHKAKLKAAYAEMCERLKAIAEA